ncbi:DUF2524 domain-containing protein [Paenibacillus sp. 481]|uniref:DUF2524 domain-containing protein n=1 Tax=Paenibacillus sp. 481 TaxID=2835869 RepID=UPI001E58CD47|nr:DUF2524 domain-containing protein [Paenibacillus sp. 481]
MNSEYDCANAHEDLPKLKDEYHSLKTKALGGLSDEIEQELHRVENQIHFVKNKCSLR